MKMPAWLKTLYDFITDKNGDGDECRFFGIAFLVYGAIFAWHHPDATATTTELIGTGILLLGGGLLGDKVKPTIALPGGGSS